MHRANCLLQMLRSDMVKPQNPRRSQKKKKTEQANQWMTGEWGGGRIPDTPRWPTDFNKFVTGTRKLNLRQRQCFWEAVQRRAEH